MNKFFLIDKPIGITSFDVIRTLRKKLNIRKIGHTGTLDPLATGGLLVATGNYTKLIPYFEKETKGYEFTIRFDGVTESFDLGTEIKFLEKEKLTKIQKTINEEYIQKILEEKFTGKIEQLPPKYSALKIGGKKAVDLVREGKDFVLKKRTINIHYIEILDFSFPEISFRAKVSSGTYIRSIASDLGDIIGTGGYVTKLRRTSIGLLDSSLFIDIGELEEDSFLKPDFLFPKDVFISLGEKHLQKINNGLPVFGEFSFPKDKDLFVFDGEYITNVVSYDGEKLFAKRKII